jgi:cytochrome c
MFTLDRLAPWALGLALVGCVMPVREASSPSRSPDLGRTASPEEIAAWDISIAPSGEDLPAGSGTARQGAAIYEAKCAACHGKQGQGKPADALVGGIGSLATRSPVRTVGSYWPYATTLFDYVRRAMPIGNPLSLSNDEVYAVSAYVLYLNGIVGEETAMSAATLPLVKMPNRDGFVNAWEGAR